MNGSIIYVTKVKKDQKENFYRDAEKKLVK